MKLCIKDSPKVSISPEGLVICMELHYSELACISILTMKYKIILNVLQI